MENKLKGYCVYKFMNELGLNHKELLVYAFIYSFTKNKNGYYYGTQKYIASELDLSMRTLQRVLHRLRLEGLIERCMGERGVGIRCTEKGEQIKKPEENKSGYRESDEYDGRFSKRNGEKIEFTPENAARVKENERRFYSNVRPKYDMISYGSEGLVRLTKEQYDALRTLINPVDLQMYFLRYEHMLKENMKTGPHTRYYN